MTRERWRQIEELYHSARESGRGVLDCVAPDLRREVERLLKQDSESALLDQPAAELLDDSTLTEFTPGAQLGPYRIEAPLGAGGMGEVFRATDTRLGREVAIKTCREQFSERFHREARAISSLNHPHICTLYDVGPNYLVMELIEGETLARRLKRGRLSIEQTVDYGSKIADALAAAHDKGIVHRDLKPGNIMLTKSGVKVLDFGLAKCAQDETLTASRVVMGTPAYMAPKQREGGECDARSDIYALGLVLYEMAAGKRFAPGRMPRELPPGLARIISKCLETDRDLRYQHASEVRTDLQRLKTRPNARAARLTGIVAAVAVVILAFLIPSRFVRSAPKLTDKDTIVLADFENKTGDPVFDDTLRQGLAVQLEQSPFLSIISDEQIRQTLKLMGQPAGARLTPAIARELCQRTGSAAVLDGSIAQIGTQYLLLLKAVNCATGSSLASSEAEANDRNHVLTALGKTASEMRRKLGESLNSVRKFDTPLEQATTSSLEALKEFSNGYKVLYGTGGSPGALPFFKRATELDPNFALAYAMLGRTEMDVSASGAAAEHTKRAYELRDHASEHAQFMISASYHALVTGNLLKAQEVCQLWIQPYPRDVAARNFLAGIVDLNLGQYEDALLQAGEAVRQYPQLPIAYTHLIFANLALNRLDDAKRAYHSTIEHRIDSPFLDVGLYTIKFVEGDTTAMTKIAARTTGKPGVEDVFLALQALTSSYFGKLAAARQFSRQAEASSQRTGQNEGAASYRAGAALTEALFGNRTEARRQVAAALSLSKTRDTESTAALALAEAGENARAEMLADDLGKRFPDDTVLQFNALPAIRAQLALNRKDPSKAIELLEAAVPYELGENCQTFVCYLPLYPVQVRAEAYLLAHKGAEAAAEFQRIIDHRGVVANEPIGALAHLGLARAHAMQGDKVKARAAYQDFLTLWKDADPDIPILKQAKIEYAKL